MYGYIYETTNLINGKKYIGKHKSSKFDKSYYGSGIALKNALTKYGKENFKVKILEEVNTNQKDLDELETYYIKKHNAVKNKNYYNRSYGGESEGWYGYNQIIKEDSSKHPMYNKHHSEEARKRMSDTRKARMQDLEYKQWALRSVIGSKRTGEQRNFISKRTKESVRNPEIILKIKAANIGKHLTEETKKKMSDTWKAKCMASEEHLRRSLQFSGIKNPMYGKHHSEETREKISLKAKERLKDPTKNPMYGKHHSEETRRKLSEAAKNRVHTYWITDGNINKRVTKLNLPIYLKNGYTLGRTCHKRRNAHESST